jgi:p-aminobenzoyl-glutamate transporter AbgT
LDLREVVSFTPVATYLPLVVAIEERYLKAIRVRLPALG